MVEIKNHVLIISEALHGTSFGGVAHGAARTLLDIVMQTNASIVQYFNYRYLG